ncbi:hypothetical protein A2U01_0072017, partial [Trifolium medium]|nr:hypothetical protein [Trifolium medium]
INPGLYGGSGQSVIMAVLLL